MSNLQYNVLVKGRRPARYHVYKARKQGFWVVIERHYHVLENDYTENIVALVESHQKGLDIVGGYYGYHNAEVCS